MKKINEYLKELEEKNIVLESNLYSNILSEEIELITYNSKEVKEKSIFICKGVNFKEEYLKEAFDNGAVLYISQKKILEDKPYIIVSDIREAITSVSSLFYDKVWNDNLKMVGITGTKGKSTTATFVKAILDEYLEDNNMPLCGFNSGIYNFDGVNREVARMTTAETLELHKNLANCVKNNVKYHVMETSSQGLKYKRVTDLHYEVCAFINFGRDHLSENEHPTMEDYFNSKCLIFRQSNYAVINYGMEDEYKEKVLVEANKYCKKVKTFGIVEGADYYAYDIKSTPHDCTFNMDLKGETYEFTCPIGGFYNAINASCAIAICDTLNIPLKYIKPGLAKAKVPGRMDVLTFKNKICDAVIDEAHNALSAETLLKSLKELYPGRKILMVFGAAGNRAKNRRQDLGEVANKYADKVILTENDPGFEKAEDIAKEIASKIDPNKIVKYIDNRVEAINYACEYVKDNWVLLAMGMGAAAAQKHGAKFDPIPCDHDLINTYIENNK